jgi:hypothetical protein
MSRQATVLIADEMYFNLYGKGILQGIYSNDLAIPTDPSTTPQLLFYFIIETDMAEPFKSLAVEVTLPGSPPIRNFVMIPPPQWFEMQAKNQSDRTRITFKHHLLIPAPTLRPGRIEMKVIHEAGEIAVTPQWVTLNPSQTAKTN